MWSRAFHWQCNCTSAGRSHKSTALLYYWSSRNSTAQHLTSISWHGSCPAGLKTDTKSTGFVLKGCLGALHNGGVSFTPGSVRAGRRLHHTLSLAHINISKGLQMPSSCFQNALTETGLLGEGSNICVINGTVRQRVTSVWYPKCIFIFQDTGLLPYLSLVFISCCCISWAFSFRFSCVRVFFFFLIPLY